MCLKMKKPKETHFQLGHRWSSSTFLRSNETEMTRVDFLEKLETHEKQFPVRSHHFNSLQSSRSKDISLFLCFLLGAIISILSRVLDPVIFLFLMFYFFKAFPLSPLSLSPPDIFIHYTSKPSKQLILEKH